MKITKSQLKKIIKEELDSMMQEIESGDGMKEFMQAVETIQSVLKDHNLAATAAAERWDDSYEVTQEWEDHLDALEQVTADPRYIEAKNYLIGLKVVTNDTDLQEGEELIIGEVTPASGPTEAEEGIDLEIVDPNKLDAKGDPLVVQTVSVTDWSVQPDDYIVSVKK